LVKGGVEILAALEGYEGVLFVFLDGI